MSNEGDHGDAFLNKQQEVLHSSIDLLSRPPSLKQSQRQGLFFVMPVNSLVVDSMFEQSKNVAIARFLAIAVGLQ